jgi:hypothetical protein
MSSLLPDCGAGSGRRAAARPSFSSSSSCRSSDSLPAVTVNKSLIHRVFQSVWQFEGTDSQHCCLRLTRRRQRAAAPQSPLSSAPPLLCSPA